MRDLSAPLDLYCERIEIGLWAEPLNALSNAAFVLAALWAWRTAQARGVSSPAVNALIALAAMIGIGSFLFHTFANGWSEYADTIPIWSFVALYVLTAVARVGGVRPGRLAVIAAAVAVCLIVFFLSASDPGHSHSAEAPILNGSLQYAPALGALLVFAGLSWRRSHPVAPWILAATATFLASLVLRTLDLSLCTIVPFGTHFGWHLLNGAMIALLLQALIRAPRPDPS